MTPAAAAATPDPEPLTVSVGPVPRPRGALYEGGMCVHHDGPTEVLAGVERCPVCVADFDAALAVCDGAPDQRRGRPSGPAGPYPSSAFRPEGT